MASARRLKLSYSCTSDVVGQMTYPDTSFTISRTNAVRLLKCPLVRDMRDDPRGLVFCSNKSVSSQTLKLTGHSSMTEGIRIGGKSIHGLC